MGMSAGGASFLLNEAAREPFTGSVLQLGKQQVFFTHEKLVALAARFGVGLDRRVEPAVCADPAFARLGMISDTSLFRSIGFEECYSLDCSDFEGSSFVFDLNRSDVPAELVGRFDVVFDGGTLEHVFHVPNVLNNIFTMLRVGGRVIHMSPSSNHTDHGFYMFSPTLFWDFYCANQFDINNIQMFRYSRNHDTEPWEVTDYHPGCLDRVCFGGLDDAMYGICLIATKTAASTGTVVPMQRSYLEWWLRQGTHHDLSDGVTAPRVQLAASNRNCARLSATAAPPPTALESFPTDVAAPALKSSGIHEDGWVSPAASCVLTQRGEAPLVIRGTLPQIGAHPVASEVRVSVDGREVLRRALLPGAVDLRCPVAPGAPGRRVELRFSQPLKLLAPDTRSVGMHLSFLGFTEPGSDAPPGAAAPGSLGATPPKGLGLPVVARY